MLEIFPKTIEPNLIPTEVLTPQSQSSFLQQMNIGNGNNSFRLDPTQGMWIGADKFADAPFSVKLDGTMVASGLTVSLVKYGKTSFTDSVNAGYHISSSGFYFGSASDASYIKYNIGTETFDFVGNVSGRASSVLASAINSAGAFINANLDTSAKTILGSFTFGVSGAIAMNTDANNGLWISPTGILGKKAGATTFAIDTSGNATFAGALSAATGTLGAITITDTFTTAGSGQRISIGALSVGLKVYNTDGTSIALIQPTDTGTLLSATSPNTASRMFQFIQFIQNGSQANSMVYLEAADVSTGTTLLELNQKGDNTAQIINLQTTSTASGLVITHLGDGLCGDFYLNNASANNYAVRVRSTATAIDALYAEHSVNTMTPAHFRQTGSVVANTHNYYRVLKLNGGGITKTIWISDGYSPNTDALSGGIGDICMNCDSGKAYYNNNGSTGWTSM